MIKNVDNVGVAVRDFRAAAEFYGKLGFQTQFQQGDSASFRAGEAVLYVFQTSSSAPPVARAVSLTGNAPGIDHISFRVDDVDQSAERLRAAGVNIETGPEDQDWGSRTITMLDPDGNRIWFLGPLKGGST
jgi:catechol 2,3-dioxygenase-like lactoylglutathione lyase family enzyme